MVIRGHRWKKAEMRVDEVMKLYMNPGSPWLKRFSCTCGKIAYPCPVCAKNNLTFFGFINNYRKVWSKMDETGANVKEEPQSGQEHRRELESIRDQLRDGSLSYPIILIHETNTDVNHRLAASLMAKKANDTLTVYYGELKMQKHKIA
ncbi:hypothetical protein PP175_12750 [Aneurinibacillus sp. Ricciae_BoGa-3]|uniref:hypothetical protein n=1 Tax=Aneurinibacillus sp. Ricciae_BoGa-3 TaxID=3022697 RepID=UPI0023420C1C|nr:hypothetical protein [Aneurinibacillus sp. Ricciae_BoGa-3]WCK52331.1 hypothetical protein PP175_12750 [Aneurinibacillus sp. Ricciae_BoGa-3]